MKETHIKNGMYTATSEIRDTDHWKEVIDALVGAGFREDEGYTEKADDYSNVWQDFKYVGVSYGYISHWDMGKTYGDDAQQVSVDFILGKADDVVEPVEEPPSEVVDEEVEPLTPFQAAGYTKDTKFKVTAYSMYLTEGDIVWLELDDGSDCPLFTNGSQEAYMALPEHGEDGNSLEVVTEDSPVASCASPETTIEDSLYVGSLIEQSGVAASTEGLKGIDLKGISVVANTTFTVTLKGQVFTLDESEFKQLLNAASQYWEMFDEQE